MKRIHTTKSIAEAVALKSHLESEGLDAAVEEDQLAGIALIPDLAATYGVYVLKSEDLDAAEKCVVDFLAEQDREVGGRWKCDGCGEVAEPQFTSCWNCGMERGPSAVVVRVEDGSTKNAHALDDDGGRVLASRWARLGGLLVDIAIELPIVIAVAIPLGIIDFGTFWGEEKLSLQQTILGDVLGLGLFFVVNGYLLAKRGQTIGKIICGTRIVDADGRVPPFLKLVVMRYVIFHVAFNVPFLGGIAGWANALMIFGKEKRCLHDRLAGTWVEKVNAPEDTAVSVGDGVKSGARGTISMKLHTHRRAIATTCLAGVVAIVCVVLLWLSCRAWLEKRALVALLRDDVQAWNELRETRAKSLDSFSGLIADAGFEVERDARPDAEAKPIDSYSELMAALGIEVYSFVVDLKGVDLTGADLGGADFSRVDLAEANLEGIRRWDSADFEGANIRGVKNAPKGFVEFAKNQGAVEVSPDGQRQLIRPTAIRPTDDDEEAPAER